MDYSIRSKESLGGMHPLPLLSSVQNQVNTYPQLQDAHSSQGHTQPWTSRGAEGDEEDAEVSYHMTKLKMFQMGPMNDPVKEERRQRAIYAKRNREMKKREVTKLQDEAAALHTIKEKYQTEVSRMHELVRTHHHRIQELELSLSNAIHQLRVKEQQLRSNQEKLNRMRAHLEMIAEGSEENSMSRRMILNLLAATATTAAAASDFDER